MSRSPFHGAWSISRSFWIGDESSLKKYEHASDKSMMSSPIPTSERNDTMRSMTSCGRVTSGQYMPLHHIVISQRKGTSELGTNHLDFDAMSSAGGVLNGSHLGD